MSVFLSSERRFLAINFYTIVSLFAVILAGGIVRSSGSGMGCPDWPKCFGRIIPPVNVSQLPANYENKFVQQRVKKNERFANILDVLGFGKLATEIREDKSILKTEEFNMTKTWTEYINRLVGVITGFLLIASALLSVTYLKSRKRIFVLSFINVILVGFQGWLGSIVVSTNLLAWTITVHMLLALAILGVSIYTYFQARILRERNLLPSKPAGVVKAVAMLLLILTVIQIILGTGVREQIDMVSDSLDLDRSAWVSKIGAVFDYHRDLAIAVFSINVVLFFMIRSRYILSGYQFKFAYYSLLIMFLQALTGIILSYFALPPVAQALHIFFATLLFGSQYYLLLLLGRYKLYRTR